jgi:hypothetical protein
MMPFYHLKGVPQLVVGFIKGGKVTPIRPDSTPGDEWHDLIETVWPVAEQCWEPDPKRRPTSEEVLGSISELNVLDGRRLEFGVQKPKKASPAIDYRHVCESLHRVSSMIIFPTKLRKLTIATDSGIR